MATQPPSFYGQVPNVGRLPQPIDSAAPLVEGVNAVARAVTQAEDSRQASNDRVRESDLQTQRIAHERDVQRRTTDAAAYIATEGGNLQVDLIKMRETAQPGAEGYDQQVDERIGQFRDTVGTYLNGDPELAARFTDNIASIAASARVGEADYAAKARATKSVSDLDTLTESLGASAYTKSVNGQWTGQDLGNAISLMTTAVRAQPIPGNAQDAEIKANTQIIVARAVEGSIQFNPDAVIEQIDKGSLNDSGLDSKQLTQLRQQAVTVSEHRAALARSAANEGAAVQRAQARTLVEDVNSGVLVDTKTLQGALTTAQAGTSPEDINLAHDLTIALAKNQTTASYDSATQDEKRSAMREIEATKDWQKDERLVAAHDQLQALLNRDDHAASEDTLSLYARQTGAALPAASLADPKSMAQRFVLGDRAAERYHKPPAYLTEDEAAHLREEWNTGTPSAKADMVQTIGMYGPQRGRAIMRQLAPQKPEFARLAEIASLRNPAAKALVREAMDGWSQPAMKGDTMARVNAEAQRVNGGLLGKMPGDRAGAVLAVARGIYAHRAHQRGIDSFNSDLVRESLEAALGGAGGAGGFGKTPKGDAMVLPMGIGQDDFSAIMRSANAHDRAVASNGVPLWTTGKPLTESQFRDLVPVLVSDSGSQTIYAFKSSGGSTYLKTATGNDFVLDFRRLVAALKGRR